MRNFTQLLTMAAVAGFVSASTALAVPTSDGSIYFEQFTGNTNGDGKTALIGSGANYAGEAADIVTVTETEGVARASTLGLTAAQEWVLEYDMTVRTGSGDNFFLLFMQAAGAPYTSGIQIRAIPVDASTYNFQIDYGAGLWQVETGYNLNQAYHVTVHHKDASNVDLYIDGGLIGTFADRDNSLGIDLVQFGDGSTGAGFGSAVFDNISIGNNIPEPASIGLVLIGATVMLKRRR